MSLIINLGYEHKFYFEYKQKGIAKYTNGRNNNSVFSMDRPKIDLNLHSNDLSGMRSPKSPKSPMFVKSPKNLNKSRSKLVSIDIK